MTRDSIFRSMCGSQHRYLQYPSAVVKAHRSTVTSIYRSILDMGSRFPDDVASDYIIWRARTMFRRRAMENSYKHVQQYVKEALRYRRRVSRALDGDFASFTYILELAYGGRGRVKHLMKVRPRNPTKNKWMHKDVMHLLGVCRRQRMLCCRRVVRFMRPCCAWRVFPCHRRDWMTSSKRK